MPNFKIGWSGVLMSDSCFMYSKCILIVYRESCNVLSCFIYAGIMDVMFKMSPFHHTCIYSFMSHHHKMSFR